MKKLMFFAVLVGVTSIMSCDTEDISCQRVSSKIVSEQRTLTGYDGIVFSAVGDVFISQGTDFSFTMQGPENVVEALTTEIIGSDLLISSTRCFNGIDEGSPFTINITIPVVRSLDMSGTGSMKSVNTLTGNFIEIAFNGVGYLDVDIEADSLHSEITGSGAVKLAGVVGKHDIIQASVAEVSAYGLVADSTIVDHRGVGNLYFYVNALLKVSLSGTGNIYYKGNPVIDKQITGTGEVIDAN